MLFYTCLVLGVEEKCIGQFKLIFSLLRMSEAQKLQQLALEVRKANFISHHIQIYLNVSYDYIRGGKLSHYIQICPII